VICKSIKNRKIKEHKPENIRAVARRKVNMDTAINKKEPRFSGTLKKPTNLTKKPRFLEDQ